MADKKKRGLPRPPGQRKAFGDEAEDDRGKGLIADELAEAAAKGRLEEYLDRELGGSEQARALAAMMMGMTGMLPPEGVSQGAEGKEPAGGGKKEEKGPAGKPPPDVVEAARAGDAGRLMELLEREHEKREPEAGKKKKTGKARPAKKAPAGPGPMPEDSAAKHVAEGLAKIAGENGLSVDWVVFRALKLYVEDYARTGRL